MKYISRSEWPIRPLPFCGSVTSQSSSSVTVSPASTVSGGRTVITVFSTE